MEHLLTFVVVGTATASDSMQWLVWSNSPEYSRIYIQIGMRPLTALIKVTMKNGTTVPFEMLQSAPYYALHRALSLFLSFSVCVSFSESLSRS